MKLALKILKWSAVILVLLLFVGSGGAFWFLTKGYPLSSGTLQLKGLRGPVRVIRDQMGVPNIYATNTDDLFFAQGYVHAQDRLWQMELFRHIGHGRTAELQGKSGLDNDKFLRTIGLARAARADWQVIDEEGRRILNDFSAGVNAYIESHRSNLPAEYTLIGISPEPWSPLDSLVWAKVMAFDLGGNRSAEIVRSQMIEKLGAEKAHQIWPDYPTGGPFIIPPEAKNYAFNVRPDHTPDWLGGVPLVSLGSPNLESIALNDMRMQLGDGIGSNNWVVDGTKTTTGKPLLANDPHLSIQMPAIWYAIGLHCESITAECPYDVSGMALSPDPGIVAGHNDRVAWGVTNTGPDVQDYFIEKVNPTNPNQYEFQGKMEDMQVLTEIIKVKGGEDVKWEVRITRHGPIMTPVLSGVTVPLALQWTAIRETSRISSAIIRIDRARNFDEFRDALKDFDAPSQNFVFEDVDGNIGYQMPGRIPIRAKGFGLVPVPGWNGEYEWTGYIPFDELPFVYNPPTHYIATANHAVVPTMYKYFITSDWSAPFRAIRINDMLNSKDKFSVSDIATIQGDVTSIPMQELQKSLVGLSIEKQKVLQTRAMEIIKGWDGRLSAESAGGAILEQTYRRVGQNVFGNKMSKDTFNAYFDMGGVARMTLLKLLDQPDSDWWDEPSTPQKETRDDVLRKSFEQAADDLGQFGSDPGQWSWGRLHTATFAHPVGSVQPLNLIFNVGPLAVPGDGFTVFNTGFKETADFSERTVSSFRLILDAGDWNRSLQIHTTGESGQALNKHYSDMTTLWRDVKYVPMFWDRSKLETNAEAVLTLTP